MRRASSSVAGSTRRSSRQPSLLKPASSVLNTCIGTYCTADEASMPCCHAAACAKWQHGITQGNFSGREHNSFCRKASCIRDEE